MIARFPLKEVLKLGHLSGFLCVFRIEIIGINGEIWIADLFANELGFNFLNKGE